MYGDAMHDAGLHSWPVSIMTAHVLIFYFPCLFTCFSFSSSYIVCLGLFNP